MALNLVLPMLPGSSVFDQLVAKDQELTVTTTDFHAACAELAAKNGSGIPTRQRILRALQTRGTSRGAGR